MEWRFRARNCEYVDVDVDVVAASQRDDSKLGSLREYSVISTHPPAV